VPAWTLGRDVRQCIDIGSVVQPQHEGGK
jgi:hypothetical protein